MRLLIGFVVLVMTLMAVNWPAATVRCQAMSENVTFQTEAVESVRRGQGWLVVADPEGHEEAKLWIYDTETNREIATYSVKCGLDGMLTVHVPIDERFDGVNECWMWVEGR